MEAISKELSRLSIYKDEEAYTGGNFFTVNLAWWNGLSADAQAAIQEATDSLAKAEGRGNVAECQTVLDAAAEFTGYTFQ